MATVREIKPTKKVVTQVHNDLVKPTRKLRVCAYARVSTKQEEQENSYELQIREYTKRINENPKWEFVDMYSDKGISGTSLKNRDGFNKMIEDAKAGKIDLILTKSISRFGRNVSDILRACQELRDINVEIIFEKENLSNMNTTTDFILTIMSGMAQEESRSISENVKWGIRKRFQEGIHHLNTENLYGYDRDNEDNIIIDDNKADVVRRIYSSFIAGLSPSDIAKELNNNKIPSPKGKKWQNSVILSILGNEKFCGDAILQKQYTASYLSHKKVKNEGQVPSYYVTDDHIPIVDKETFNKVKILLEAYKNSEHSTSALNLPLYGIVYCATCGEIMKRVPGADGRNKLWCNFLRKEGSCSAGYVDYEDVLVAATDAVTSMVSMNIIVKEVNETLSEASNFLAEEIRLDTLEKEIAKLIKDIDKLIDLRLKSNEMTESAFKTRYNAMKKELEEKEELFNQLQDEYQKKKNTTITFEITAKELLEKDSFVASNMLFRRLFKCILYKEKTIYMVLNTPTIATSSVKDLLKTFERQRIMATKDMLFGKRRHLSYKVIRYGN